MACRSVRGRSVCLFELKKKRRQGLCKASCEGKGKEIGKAQAKRGMLRKWVKEKGKTEHTVSSTFVAKCSYKLKYITEH